MKLLRLPISVLLTAIVLLLAPTIAQADVSPSSANLTVNAGGTATESKTVTVPALPQKADIEIAIDTTGSMSSAISEAQSQATQLVNKIHTDIPDTNFSVVDFKDAVDGSQEYVVRQSNTNDATLVQNAINAMTAGGGGDYPEAQNLVLANATPDGPPCGGRIRASSSCSSPTPRLMVRALPSQHAPIQVPIRTACPQALWLRT